MRQALRWTAALTLGLATAGCSGGSGAGEESAAATAGLERDLTLSVAAAPALEVASPVELGRPEPPASRPTPRRRSAPKPAPAPAEAPPEPDAAPTPEPVAVPVSLASTDLPDAAAEAPMGAGRELLPGQTVTMIPASSGPSNGGDDIGLPAEPGRGMFKGGAGNCPHPPRGVGGRPVGISRLPLLTPRR